MAAPRLWLCHSDARQVFDLPGTPVLSSRSSTFCVGPETAVLSEGDIRQVKDLPRIGVAEPGLEVRLQLPTPHSTVPSAAAVVPGAFSAVPGALSAVPGALSVVPGAFS